MNKDKVAVLRVPARTWDTMSAQEQLLFTMQQMLGFMASEFFADMEGVAIQAVDPAIAKPRTVFSIGKKPSELITN